jgi:hypothetical protein
MKQIVLLGAGGAAGRNFKKAVDYAVALRNDDPIRWHLVDSDMSALLLYPDNPHYNYLACVPDFHGLLANFNQFDMIHSQPEEGVEYLIQYRKFNPDVAHKVFDNSMTEYTLYRDKFKCQQEWVDKMHLSFWVKDAEMVGKKEFYKRLKNQPNGKLWLRAAEGAGSRGALPVSEYIQLKGWLSYWRNQDPKMRFILSDILTGPEYAVQMLWINGDLRISQARQRIAYLFSKQMPSGQSSTPSVSMSVVYREVYDAAYKAVTSLTREPHGIYGVDMKVNLTNEELVPTEINYGRFYTTSHQYMDYTPNPLNIPYEYASYILYDKIPSLRINSLPPGIMHYRGIDSEGKLVWQT